MVKDPVFTNTLKLLNLHKFNNLMSLIQVPY
jgi:hypothetical protein